MVDNISQHLSFGSAGNLKKCQPPGVERCQICPGNLSIPTHHLVNVMVLLALLLVLRDLILFLWPDHVTVSSSMCSFTGRFYEEFN